VVLVEPLPVVRTGIRLLIDQRDGIEVLAEAANAGAALGAVAAARRSRLVVLVSLSLSGEVDGYGLLGTLRNLHPTLTLLALGAGADAAAVSRALFVGADGYLDEQAEPDEFIDALARAATDEMVLIGPAASQIGTIAGEIERHSRLGVRLTEREREVLEVAAEGLTARQIATRLGVRERTVTTHLARIYDKLGVSNRIAALRTAERSGLVSIGID
jgi:DNA-binding NarL/FixJ family response regulator